MKTSIGRRGKLRWQSWIPVVVLCGLCGLIGSLNPQFFTVFNLLQIMNAAAIPIVLCMGATFVILMGSIDLSVEGVMSVAAVSASLVVANQFSQVGIGFGAIPLAMLVGAAIGALNGTLHVRLKISSFMTTLGIGFAGIGLAKLILAGQTVRVVDSDLRLIAIGRIGGLPIAVIIAFAAVLAAYVIQQRTRVGRWTYAIGTDESIAIQAGVPVKYTRIMVFAIAGLFYGLGAVMTVAQFGQAHALVGQGRLFSTITAVVVGGTALSGGVGSILTSILGVFIVVVLSNGMVLMGVPSFLQEGVQGVLILTAVALSLDRSRQSVVK